MCDFHRSECKWLGAFCNGAPHGGQSVRMHSISGLYGTFETLNTSSKFITLAAPSICRLLCTEATNLRSSIARHESRTHMLFPLHALNSGRQMRPVQVYFCTQPQPIAVKVLQNKQPHKTSPIPPHLYHECDTQTLHIPRTLRNNVVKQRYVAYRMNIPISGVQFEIVLQSVILGIMPPQWQA